MSFELIIVIIAVAAVVGLVALFVRARRTRVAATPSTSAQRPGRYDGARDVIDGSVGMYVLRRLTGRATAPPVDTAETVTVLSPEEVAYRIGVPDAPAPAVSKYVRSAATDAAATAAAARAAAAAHVSTSASSAVPAREAVAIGAVSGARSAAAPSVTPAMPRERLVRDAGIALIALAGLGLVALLIWPGGPAGPAPTHLAVTLADPTERPSGHSTASDNRLCGRRGRRRCDEGDIVADRPAHGETRRHAQPDRDACPVIEGRTGADTETDAASHPDADTHTHRDTDSDPEADAEADREADTDPDTRTAGRQDLRVGDMRVRERVDHVRCVGFNAREQLPLGLR